MTAAGEERTSYLNLGQPDVDEISGQVHPGKKFAVLQLNRQIDMHVHKVSDLRLLAAVATQLADELEDLLTAEVTEVDRLRARVAELEAAAGGTA